MAPTGLENDSPASSTRNLTRESEDLEVSFKAQSPTKANPVIPPRPPLTPVAPPPPRAIAHQPLPLCPASSSLHQARDKSVVISCVTTASGLKRRMLYQPRDEDNNLTASTRVAMDALCDLRAHTVVLLGDARLKRAKAEEKVEEYREYEDKKSRNLVRMPKSLDDSKKKGRGRPKGSVKC